MKKYIIFFKSSLKMMIKVDHDLIRLRVLEEQRKARRKQNKIVKYGSKVFVNIALILF